MANEARIQSSLQISIGVQQYLSRPTVFLADVSVADGPSPGSVTVSTAGTDISFSQLTNPSLCRLMNLDSTNTIEVGVWDPDTAEFYPLLELLPGETFVVRLSSYLGSEMGLVGTGTTGSGVTMRAKAVGAASVLLVEAFGR